MDNPNLIAENIRNGTSINGITGTLNGETVLGYAMPLRGKQWNAITTPAAITHTNYNSNGNYTIVIFDPTQIKPGKTYKLYCLKPRSTSYSVTSVTISTSAGLLSWSRTSSEDYGTVYELDITAQYTSFNFQIHQSGNAYWGMFIITES